MNALRRWLSWRVLDRRIRQSPRKPRRGPERSPEYRSWLRTYPCCCCGACTGIEAAHTGSHGLGQKSSDFRCIPLCPGCHRTGRYSLHHLGPAAFESIWSVNINGLAAEYRRLWRQQ